MTLNKTNQEKLNVLKKFLSCDLKSTEGVFSQFIKDGLGKHFKIDDNDYYLIDGTKKDKILFVAHADTVWDTRILKFRQLNNELAINFDNYGRSEIMEDQEYIYNNNSYYGLGADDRAGIAALWLIRNSGHSILITDNEEVGARGAKALASNSEYMRWVDSHCFAIQLDLSHNNYFKCYSSGSENFKNFIEKTTGYEMLPNFSHTDISFLCKNICGANLSIGYRYEHSPHEILVKEDWLKSVEKVEILVNSKIKKYAVDREFSEKTKPENFKTFKSLKAKTH